MGEETVEVTIPGDRPTIRPKRVDASDLRLCRRDMYMMVGGFQEAASMSTRPVASDTSLRSPPIVPDIDVGPSAS